MTSIISLRKRWQNVDIFTLKMQFLSNSIEDLTLMLCIIEFNKLVAKKR